MPFIFDYCPRINWIGLAMLRTLLDLKMIVFDLDGVLVDIDSSWQKIHETLGVNNDENFQKHLRGQIDFKEFMRSDILLWGNINITCIMNILAKAPYMKGAKETLIALHEAGYKSAIISSGISILADRVKNELEIDYSFANKLLHDPSGVLTGEGEEVVGLLNKDKILHRLVLKEGITTQQCVVLGDSQFDAALFKDAGLSIAFNAKDEVVKDAADLIIDGKDLTKILPWLVNDGESSMVEMSFNYDDEKEAEALVEAISPDNRKFSSEVIIKTVRENNMALTRIYCIKGIETLLATLDDILRCSDVADEVINITKLVHKS